MILTRESFRVKIVLNIMVQEKEQYKVVTAAAVSPTGVSTGS
jgi:hypothetical protein